MRIGQWVKRKGKTKFVDGEYVGPKWHRIESVVNDEAIVTCGRTLPPKEGDEISNVEVSTRAIGQPQNCKTCR